MMKDLRNGVYCLDIVKNYIRKELVRITKVDEKIVNDAIDIPTSLDKGDFMIPFPRLRMKNVNGEEKCLEICQLFDKNEYLSDVKSEKNFLQFFINKKYIIERVINEVLSSKSRYGYTLEGANKKIIIEFSSPNIAKPFHAGHLRSTIIGNFLTNLYEKNGWKVLRYNYLGDWGKQFGVLAVGFQRYGDEEQLEVDAIKHLFDVYVKTNRDIENEGENSKTSLEANYFFKRMEEEEPEAIKLWERFRNLSIKQSLDIYSRLNIKFDVFSGESQVSKRDIEDVGQILEKLGMIEKKDNAEFIKIEMKKNKIEECLFRRSDGTTLYLTRDIGEAIKRYKEHEFDRMIYVVASQQDIHLNKLFSVIKQMGFAWHEKLVLVNFGMVLGMSTRKGAVVFLDNILNETQNEMHKVMIKNKEKYAQISNPEKIADIIGISSVVVQDMQSKRINNYSFNWNRMFSFEGDTGPYLQYAHSRLASIIRNCPYDLNDFSDFDASLLIESCAENLIRIISQYPFIVKRALENHEPCTIVTYLFNLTHSISECYDKLWVLNQEKNLAITRLSLYKVAKQTLSNGIELLGLTPVDRM